MIRQTPRRGKIILPSYTGGEKKGIMKVAVLADIHANLIALETVIDHVEAWGPDEVIIDGDVVNRGPRPAECLQRIAEKQRSAGWKLVRGNHEDYVISQAAPQAARSGPAFEVHKASYWTLKQLGFSVQALKAMPFQQQLIDPAGERVYITHGSLLGTRDGIYPEMSDRDLTQKIPTHTPMFCVGHTHRPLVRSLNGTLVVNAGSVGLPFDGDTRPSYAQLTWHRDGWQARIVRLDYDLAAAEEDFYRSGYYPQAGPLVDLVLIELRTASSQLYNWSARFQQDAMLGNISMQDSVRRYLGK
jgi:putative phosphoesterase